MGGRGDDQVRLGRYRGKFCAVIGAGRARQRISLGTADPGLARTRLAEFVQQRDRLSRPNRITVGAILTAYLADRRPEVAEVRMLVRVPRSSAGALSRAVAAARSVRSARKDPEPVTVKVGWAG